MTREYFEHNVRCHDAPAGVYAIILHNGKRHSAIGIDEQEARINLWEYLCDEIGI